jgi:hypothetical protein
MLLREGSSKYRDTACQLRVLDAVQHHIAIYRKTRYYGEEKSLQSPTHFADSYSVARGKNTRCVFMA